MSKGTNERWRDMFSPSDLARYADAMDKHFATDLARWVSFGQSAQQSEPLTRSPERQWR
jgi:hypothetical protein